MPRYALTGPGIRRCLDAVAKEDAYVAAALKRLGYPSPRRRAQGMSTLMRIIVGQQVSTKAAATVFGRLEDAAGDLDDPAGVLRMRVPRLRKVGLSGQKAAYVRSLARAIDRRELDLAALRQLDDDEAIDALTAVKGLGVWSAQMYLMFSLGRPDVWPSGDLGVRAGLAQIRRMRKRPTPAATTKLAKAWRPHRSGVAMLCWASVNAPPA